MIAVVIKARRRKKGKEIVKSQYNVEGEPLEGKVPKDNVDTYHYVRDQPTPWQSEDAYDYATAENIFVNPASATASFSTHVYDSTNYSEVVERSLADDEETHNEEAKAEVSSGGGCEEPVKGTRGKQKNSDVKNAITKVVKPEELYTQPDKLTKKRKFTGGGGCCEENTYGKVKNSNVKKASAKVVNPEELYTQPDKLMKKRKNMKKDTQVSRTEEVAAPCEDLYAKPDMTKKKDKRSQQQWEQKSEKRKPVPTAPLSTKSTKKKSKREADIPDEPSLHVSDEDQ